MKLTSTINLLFLTGSISYASSLLVYKDQSIYIYKPNNTFIGLTKNVKAKCNGETLPLHEIVTCPGDKKLCKELIALEKTQQVLLTLQSNSKILNQLITLPKPTSFNASELLKTAKVVAKENAKLHYETEKTINELELKKLHFKKSARSKNALISSDICKEDLELTIPYGFISFSTAYEADITNANEINVIQYLSVINRSGIDIEVDMAKFYYRNANQYVRPVYFNPWVVRTYDANKKRKMLKKSKLNSPQHDEVMMVNANANFAKRESVALYVDAREYKIDYLNLPSTGMPVDVKLTSWKAKLSCELKAYPYIKTKVFKVCSFEPKYQIDNNSWKIKSEKTTINNNAVGEYLNGKYNLYTQIDEDLKIIRKHIVKKERESGIFGNEIRKKDGYVLTLTNKSDKVKQITITERIPTSSNDKIKVKLLNIKSNKNIDYKVLKDGKIEMKLNLAANENRKIEVLFEISHDKDLKVRY